MTLWNDAPNVTSIAKILHGSLEFAVTHEMWEQLFKVSHIPMMFQSAETIEYNNAALFEYAATA